MGERAPYVPEKAAVADNATTPLAHRVRQGIGAEEQLSRAQGRQGAQPVSPVGGAELFHLQRLHPFHSLRTSDANRVPQLAGFSRAAGVARLRPARARRPRGGADAVGPLRMPRPGPEASGAGVERVGRYLHLRDRWAADVQGDSAGRGGNFPLQYFLMIQCKWEVEKTTQ